MRQLKHTSSHKSANRSAFTLVEMLVSVTLVLMMMTLFASIFQMATGTMGKQRSISENDQRARSLTTVIRRDLQHRTMRYPFAFYPDEESATSPTSFSNRSGYFYLSTNDPNSGLDDLIQFTVSANILSEDPDGTPFYGAAAPLRDRRTDISIGATERVSLAINANQPETDDGSVNANSVGSSPAAEVSYFVRQGNLYRRVLLIREPLAFAGQNLADKPTSRSGYEYFSGQPDPTDNTTYDGLFEPTGQNLTNDFYRLFDYSAFTRGPPLQKAEFLGVATLNNEQTDPLFRALAIPSRRFGFNPFNGISREHTSLPSAGFGVPKFIGRFTQAETSTLNFNWPQATSRNEPVSPTDTSVPDLAQVLQVDMDLNGSLETSTNGNPFDITGCPLQLNTSNGLVSSFDAATTGEGRGGIRRMEDLLLANVHEMKVEIWDDRLQRYVTPGHTSLNPNAPYNSFPAPIIGEAGDYHVTRCRNLSYGPLGAGSAGRVLDTWHPDVDLNNDGTAEHPPYIPYLFYPPKTDNVNTITMAAEPGPIASTAPFLEPSNTGYWTANKPYSPGDVVFAPYDDLRGNIPNAFDYGDIQEPKFNIAYRCIVGGTSNSGTSPDWPVSAGRRKTEAGGSVVVWESFDNRRPLKSLRLQIRFYDSTSDSMRQVSLVLPMTEVK